MSKSREIATIATFKAEAADHQAHRLNAAAQSMSGIVELIGNITGQINMLALNATIESARAGEAGRGFAVVAAEVKNLANRAKSATDTISKEISSLNNIAPRWKALSTPSRVQSRPSTNSSLPLRLPWKSRAS